MADIAQLGFAVDSKPIVRARDELGRFVITANKVEGATGGVTAAVTSTNAELGKTAPTANRATAGIVKLTATQKMLRQLETQVSGVSKALDMVSRIGYAAAGGAVVGQILAQVDAYTQLSSRINTVSASERELNRVRQETYRIAQETRQGFGSTADLYVSLTRATENLGLAESKRLQLTETINKALIIGGGSTQAMDAAVRQLSQGLAAGALRGDEFNSVAEQAPILMDLLGRSLKMTRGELIEFAAEGGITAEILVGALSDGVSEVDAKFAKMEVTIGQAATRVMNAVVQLAGTFSNGSGLTGAIVENLGAVEDLAEALTGLAALIAYVREESEALGAGLGLSSGAMGGFFDAVNRAINPIQAIRDGLHGASESVKEWTDATGEVNTFDALEDGWRQLLRVGKGVVSQVMEATAETQKYTDKLDDQAAKARMTAAEFILYKAAQEAATKATQGERDAIMASAQAAADAVQAKENLAASTKAQAEAQREAAKAAREEQKAVRAIDKAWSDYASIIDDVQRDHAAVAKAYKQQKAHFASQARDIQNEIDMLGVAGEARDRMVIAIEAERLARDANGSVIEEERQRIEELLATLDEATKLDVAIMEFEVRGLDDILRKIDELNAGLEKVGGQKLEDLLTSLGNARQEAILFATDALGAGISSLQSMAEEGSSAYKKLEIAQAALNLATAIGAIANQGMGDPYTAFARIAAMIAAMQQLGLAVSGGSGGPSAASAEVMQARQGTGTVLGDAEAKSESILNAMEITADATSELVGINRGMLRALQTLESGIGSASGMIARGGSAVDVGPLSSGGGILSGLPDPLGLSNMIFGGRQELIDQGIMIMGGTLNDLINNITVGAYNTIETDGGWFSSNDTDTNVTDITDQFGQQFSLIIESIAATVREGALALGLLPADIEAAMAAYQVEATRISLMGLSAEEQQAELTAVFSSIFDGLAGSVVPWVEQFQQLGEGLGETLVRVATSVQVTQEAMLQLGFALDQTDPEQFAQIAVGLIELTGGIDEFISGMSSFVSNFAPEAHQFAVAQDALTRALSQYGLEIPASRDGMWALMQSLDATTESGREQIATLLRLAGVADAYYSMLEDRASDAARAEADAAAEAARAQEEAAEIATRAEQARIDATLEYARLVTDLNLQLLEASGASEYARSMAEIGVAERQRIEALHASARAAGLASASEEDVARAYQLSTLQRARAERQLTESARGVVDQLYSPMTALDEQISALQASESAASSAIGDLGDSISDMGQIASDIANAMLGPFSSLKGRAKADYALKALSEGLVSLDTALQVGSSVYASGADFNAFRDAAFARAAARPQEQNTPTAIGNSVSRAMQELLDQRAALEAEQTRAERFGLAGELAQQIADLSLARGTSFDEVLESLGITGSQLQTDLGLSSEAALMEYLTALQAETRSFADLWTRATYGEQMIVDAINEAWHLQNIPPDPLLNPQPLPPVDPPGKEPVARPKALEEAQAAQIDELKAAIVTLTTQQAEQSRLIAALLARIAGSSESAAGSLHQIEVGGVMDRVRHASQETRIDPKPKPRVAVKP